MFIFRFATMGTTIRTLTATPTLINRKALLLILLKSSRA